MPDLVGPIQALGLANWLWLVVAFPLVGALMSALYGSGLGAHVGRTVRAALADGDDAPKPEPVVAAPAATSSAITKASLALAAVASLVHVALLVGRPASDRFLASPLWQLVRVGQLDLTLGLAFDTLAAGFVSFVAVAAFLVSVAAFRSQGLRDAGTAWRFSAVFCAFVAAVLLALLADNVVMTWIGWVCAATLGASLHTGGEARDLDAWSIAERGADGLFLVAVALLFWGLGGRWVHGNDYQGDLEPRIAAVSVASPGDALPEGGEATKGKGFLTVTALPESLVYADDSHSPLLAEDGLPLTTPFRMHELAGGAHAFRLAPDDRFHTGGSKFAYAVDGGALANYTVARVAFGANREVVLALIGPTLTYREMDDELALSTAKGERPVRDRVLARKLWSGVGVVTVACLAFLLVAATKSAATLMRWRRKAPEALPSPALPTFRAACGLSIAAYLMARLGFLFALSPAALGALEVAGAVLALAIVASMLQRSKARHA